MSNATENLAFTMDVLAWDPWLDIVEPGSETIEQAEVLTESGPLAAKSLYFRTLVHEPDILRHRSQVYNAILYSRGGLSRSERELASTAVSRANGCVYCASVHSRRFQQLSRRDDVIQQLFNDPSTAGTTDRERAIIAFSIALTHSPDGDHQRHIETLRHVGLSELELLDLIHCIAIFAWANRLMMNLGGAVHEGGAPN